jgi:hypothetical protein
MTVIDKKRPDGSFRFLNRLLPNPSPAWIKYLPNGKPYPNLVVEVAVMNEDPTQITDIMNRYFSAATSVNVWVGVKVWMAEKKFWAGWASRNAAGIGGVMHTQMAWPPDNSPLDTPVNVVYSIPTQIIYGPNIPLPPNSPPNILIDVDGIRNAILDALN